MGQFTEHHILCENQVSNGTHCFQEIATSLHSDSSTSLLLPSTYYQTNFQRSKWSAAHLFIVL